MCMHMYSLPTHGQVSQLRLQEGVVLQCASVHVHHLVGCGSSAQRFSLQAGMCLLNAEYVHT